MGFFGIPIGTCPFADDSQRTYTKSLTGDKVKLLIN